MLKINIKESNYMKTEHLNNLSFEIPDDWIIEKNENNFLM